MEGSLFISLVYEPTSMELSAWVEPFYMVTKPTSRGLSAGGAA